MATRVSSSSAVEAIDRACRRAADPDELFEVVGHELGKAVPHDGCVWFGVDPATLLAVAPLCVKGLDAGYCQTFWHDEFHEQDTALFRDLARNPVPASALRIATDDRPLRSARFRDFLDPQGYDDELRAAFRTGDSTWAVVSLYREKGRPPFTDSDVALLSAVSSTVASAYRARAALVGPVQGPANAPGLLLFDADGLLTSANAEAARWLGDLFGPRDDDGAAWLERLAHPPADDVGTGLDPFFPSLLARARAVAAGYEDGQARLRFRDRGGRWVVLHASCLEGPTGEGHVAVVVEPAKSDDIAPIILEACGLSQRERDVVRAVARGLSTPEIAAELFLSTHTVRDYIKSVFEKVGVTSRGELVAKLFAEHYADAVHARTVHIG